MNTEKKAEIHKTVLLQEVADNVSLHKGEVLVDATLNNAGHSSFIADRFGGDITILGIDQDSDALLRAEKHLKEVKAKYFLFEGNFRNIDVALEKFALKEIGSAIFDLGLSSEQLEISGRGFSFMRDEPLSMTFSKDGSGHVLSASDVVNGFEEENLETIIKGWGEETFAKRIAKAIVARRTVAPFKTTLELREVVERAVPAWYRRKKIHPATKTFQAIRIAVNDEINAITEGLEKTLAHLKVGGRIAVISFHSIEDRVVKQLFKKWEEEGFVRKINKKPITPSERELRENPRSRSSKLRIIEKI
jgi:16S rRNA (cytosine1402-N4)-methyltransferase